MPWRIGIMAALLAWLLLASSAGAAIQRHTDSRGVIHISNGPVKAAPGHQGDLAENPGPEMASLPAPAPPPARTEAQAPRPADSANPHAPATSPPADGQKDNGEKLQPAQDAADQVGQAPAAVASNPPVPGIIGMFAAAATAAAKSAAPAAAEPAATAAAESTSRVRTRPSEKSVL